jgi:hypothetical protein
MQERRQATREKVIYGGIAAIDGRGTTRDCVVRNISETGANLSFRNILNLPKEQLSLTIAKKGRRFAARVIWSNDNVLGIAFSGEQLSETPATEIEEALRLSEKKQRQLKRQIRLLTGET